MDTFPTPKHRAPSPRTVATKALLVLSMAAALTLSGCSIPGLPGPTGAPSVEQAAAVTPQPEAIPTTAPATPAKATITGDMIKGAVSHKIGAAGNQLVIDYWTSKDPASWTPESSPIIRLSASVVGSTEKNAIKITRFNARIDAPEVTLANDTGDFAVDAPHSYSSSVVVPAAPEASPMRMLFTFDLLTETAPGSGIFTRQTVMDTLTLQYATQPLPAPAPTATPTKAASS